MASSSSSSSSSSEAFAGQGQGRRVEPIRAATSMGALPLDALYDILLLLPAKELCRLRLVCRSWRALLSDAAFAADHAARYPEPLILVGCNNNPALESENGGHRGVVSIMDLSGRVVKQLRVDGHITSMSLNLACVKNTTDGGSLRLVNAATGAVHHLPKEAVFGYSNRLGPFGQVASTGEYKVLRKVSYALHGKPRVLYEIGRSSSSGAVRSDEQWRIIQDPPHCVDIDWCAKSSVVIHGVVYFLNKNSYFVGGSDQDLIAAFDLETEMWRPNIRGPNMPMIRRPNMAGPRSFTMANGKILLVNLNGSLVIVHLWSRFMKLWYLLDSDKGLWVRRYRIWIERDCGLLSFTPLIVLDDGRILIHVEEVGILKIYDPKTKKLSDVALTGLSSAVSVYTGTLLSLEW